MTNILTHCINTLWKQISSKIVFGGLTVGRNYFQVGIKVSYVEKVEFDLREVFIHSFNT